MDGTLRDGAGSGVSAKETVLVGVSTHSTSDGLARAGVDGVVLGRRVLGSALVIILVITLSKKNNITYI